METMETRETAHGEVLLYIIKLSRCGKPELESAHSIENLSAANVNKKTGAS